MSTCQIIFHTFAQATDIFVCITTFAHVQATFQLVNQMLENSDVLVLELGIQGFAIVNGNQGVKNGLYCMELMDIFKLGEENSADLIGKLAIIVESILLTKLWAWLGLFEQRYK